MSEIRILKAESSTPLPLPPKGVKRYILLLDPTFTGRIELHCRQGGVSKISKQEDIVVEG